MNSKKERQLILKLIKKFPGKTLSEIKEIDKVEVIKTHGVGLKAYEYIKSLECRERFNVEQLKHMSYTQRLTLGQNKIMKLIKSSGLYLLMILMCGSAFALDMSKAVIHHTASGDVRASTIDLWHKERGWDGIGYHFVIRANGDIEKGRSLEKNGAHARGRNHYVGIALTGRDKFTVEQIRSLIKLCKQLGIKHIERHHEECPGTGLNIEYIQSKI